MSKEEEKKSKLRATEEKFDLIKTETRDLEEKYSQELETNPKYSLEVDPENKYGMTSQQKEFIKQYVEFRNLFTAATLAEIDEETARSYFVSYASQQEIRRINRALYHRQFRNQLLSLDEIGGYLTSLLTDDFVTSSNQLKPSEKLKVAQMLIDLNQLKMNSLQNPSLIMGKDLDIQIKDLSIKTISQLISQEEKKKDPIEASFEETLTPEESAYLKTLPTEELLELLEKTNKGDKHE